MRRRKKKDGINGKTIMGNVFDPSGIVYEGVLENPVEGATVTLYYAADGNEAASGIIKETSLGSGTPTRTPTQLLTANGVRGVTPNDPVQVTGADGRYQWFVPEGLWFVTAEKGGLTGDSSGDTAATVNTAVGTLLPVLPPQLNVNIPLTDNAVPYVTDVLYKTDGIYVTFSKYMADTGGGADSALNAANYSVYALGADTAVRIVCIEPVERGGTPANRGAVTTYTRTVKLTTSEPLTAGATVTLTVAPWVTSYAGVPMGTAYSSGGTAQAPQQFAAPVFSGVRSDGGAFGGSAVEALMNRGDALTITAEDGATIYYTTDGSDPAIAADGTPLGTTKRYTAPLAVSGSMTVRAIAVRIGYLASEIATAKITQRAVGTDTTGAPVNPTPAPVNPTPTPTYGGGEETPTSAYPAEAETPEHGTVRLSERNPSIGTRVVITATPDPGYAVGKVTVTGANGRDIPVTKNPDGTYSYYQPGMAVSVNVTFQPAGTAGAGAFAGFADLDPNAWYRAGVEYALENGIMGGMGDGVFAPNAATTRAQLATILWNLEGRPASGGETGYADVDAGAWYAGAIRWASAEGLMGGYGDGRFGPDDALTREQLVTILWRCAGHKGFMFRPDTDLSGYADASDVSDWAAEAFRWAVQLKLVGGVGDNRLAPKESATRAQIATIIMRYRTEIEKP